MGWSDDEEEDGDIVDITSRGSATPVIDDCASTSESPSQSEAQEGSVFSYGTFNDQGAHVSALQGRLDALKERERPLPQSPLPSGATASLGVEQVVLRSSLLDSVLVRVGRSQICQFPELHDAAIPLESYWEHVEPAPSDAAIKATTLHGTIGGTLSGTPSFVRLPGSKIFQKVYVGMLNQPLVPGDCGSWVKNATTGKLFGHVIAGSPTTGLVILMPAVKTFPDALAALPAQEAGHRERSREEKDKTAEVASRCSEGRRDFDTEVSTSDSRHQLFQTSPLGSAEVIQNSPPSPEDIKAVSLTHMVYPEATPKRSPDNKMRRRTQRRNAGSATPLRKQLLGQPRNCRVVERLPCIRA